MVLFLQERVGKSGAKLTIWEQDATFAVLGFRAFVDTYSGSSGHLHQFGKQFVEFRAAGYLHFVDQGGNEAVRVLQCRCDGCQVLLVYTRTP